MTFSKMKIFPFNCVFDCLVVELFSAFWQLRLTLLVTKQIIQFQNQDDISL